MVTEQAKAIGQFGDLILADLGSSYKIANRGMSVVVSPHYGFTTAESLFRIIHRVDGQPTVRVPITPANGANTLSPFIALAAR